jgi:HAD superfamily hydrolase (TIGR01549 family)
MIKNIIFDWSGTLTDHVDSHYEVCCYIFRALGMEPIPKEQYKREITADYMTFWKKYAPEVSKDQQNDLYLDGMKTIESPKLFVGVKEFLDQLKEKGIKMFVVSADVPETLYPEMKSGGVYNHFEEICYDQLVKTGAIKSLIEKYNMNPEETIYVGDTIADVNSGKEAGVISIGLFCGVQDVDVLRDSKPDYLFESVMEIRKILS